MEPSVGKIAINKFRKVAVLVILVGINFGKEIE